MALRTPQPGQVNTQLLARLTADASERPRFGYRRLHTLVEREGLQVSHKRVYGVYRAAELQAPPTPQATHARATDAVAAPESPHRALVAGFHGRHARGVQLRFIRPGKPIENAFVESFNGKCRDECLNEHWFASVAEARTLIEAWRVDYNTVRPFFRGPRALLPPASRAC